MAALASTLMAVSVTVLAPTQGAATPAQAFATTAGATLGQAVQEWAQQTGQAAPQVDSAVASLSVGNIHVTGNNVCEAVGRLVAALKYSETRPQLTSCSNSAIVVASAR